MQGGDNVAVLSAGLPNITGTTFNIYALSDGTSGAMSNPVTSSTSPLHIQANLTEGDQIQRFIYFNAHKSNAIYGASNTVQPPALQLIPQIKF